MTHLTLRLLGPGVLTAGAKCVRPHSARTLALLAFLVLESGRRHPRSTLVDLLWPDLPEASGRQSLRQALYSLKTLADGRLNDCLQVDSQWVLFSAPVDDSSIDIDVQRFLSSVRGTSEGDWRAAAVIPYAPLLDGMVVVQAPDYEAWLLAARDRLRALALQNLVREMEWRYGIEHGVAAGRLLLERAHRPTAIFAANDHLAIGVQTAARLLGLVPGQDISIVGYNDIPLVAQLPVPLTSVRTPFDTIAATALLPTIGAPSSPSP